MLPACRWGVLRDKLKHPLFLRKLYILNPITTYILLPFLWGTGRTIWRLHSNPISLILANEQQT